MRVERQLGVGIEDAESEIVGKQGWLNGYFLCTIGYRKLPSPLTLICNNGVVDITDPGNNSWHERPATRDNRRVLGHRWDITARCNGTKTSEVGPKKRLPLKYLVSGENSNKATELAESTHPSNTDKLATAISSLRTAISSNNVSRLDHITNILNEITAARDSKLDSRIDIASAVARLANELKEEVESVYTIGLLPSEERNALIAYANTLIDD